MEYIDGVSTLYIRKFARKIEQYNKLMEMPAYFGPLIGDKKFVRVAELGAGPVNTIGTYWDTAKVDLVASDVLAPQYKKLWEQYPDERQLVPIEYQDMENLTYPDESFDIVHCVNALDHTKDAKKALSELERICKKGGYVYLRHSSNQKDRFGGHHYWNIGFGIADGRMCFSNGNKDEYFDVQKYETSNEYDEPPHNDFKTIITAIWKKT